MNRREKTELAFMPFMQDGETLYSWVGHYHRLSGNALTIGTSRQLFGDISGAFRHDFPSQLEHFVSVTDGVLGDHEKISYQNSLLGFFAPFQTKADVSDFLKMMQSGSIRLLKSRLGLLANRLGAFHELKFCPHCVNEDINEFQISKWYLEHQWPSSLICRKHQVFLNFVKPEMIPCRHVNLFLPHELSKEAWVSVGEKLTMLKDTLSDVVSFSAEISSRQNFHFDNQLLRYTYLVGARNKNWIRTDGSVNTKLCLSYEERYADLRSIPTLKADQLFSGDVGILKLMRPEQYQQHPIRHYLLMAHLFDSPSEFNSAYLEVSAAFDSGGVAAISDLLNEGFRSKLASLIRENGLSIAKAASAIGITFTQAKNILVKYKIHYRRRYDLDPIIEEELKQLILLGESRKAIQIKIGIDIDFLKYYLKRRPNLLEIWRIKKNERLKAVARRQYLELSERLRLSTVTQFLDAPKSKFWWLRKHDFDWLVDHSPSSVATVLLASKNERSLTG